MGKMIVPAIALALAGCFSTPRPTDFSQTAPVQGVPTCAPAGKPLAPAIVAAASRRGWTTQRLEGDAVRCTIAQRAWKVAVDVKAGGDGTFSIVPVESNLTPRKYNQWIDKLSREIQKEATRL